MTSFHQQVVQQVHQEDIPVVLVEAPHRSRAIVMMFLNKVDGHCHTKDFLSIKSYVYQDDSQRHVSACRAPL